MTAQVNTLIAVGSAMSKVADAKYTLLSTSIPTENMWCAHTKKPTTAMDSMAYIIPSILYTAIQAPIWTPAQVLAWRLWALEPSERWRGGLYMREIPGSLDPLDLGASGGPFGTIAYSIHARARETDPFAMAMGLHT